MNDTLKTNTQRRRPAPPPPASCAAPPTTTATLSALSTSLSAYSMQMTPCTPNTWESPRAGAIPASRSVRQFSNVQTEWALEAAREAAKAQQMVTLPSSSVVTAAVIEEQPQSRTATLKRKPRSSQQSNHHAKFSQRNGKESRYCNGDVVGKTTPTKTTTSNVAQIKFDSSCFANGNGNATTTFWNGVSPSFRHRRLSSSSTW